MKKPIIALITMLIAAAVSVGLYFVAKDRKEKDDKAAADKAADKILFNFNSDDVKKVEFSCADGDYTAELVDSEWQLTSGGDFALDQSYLSNVCIYAAQLTAENSYEPDDSKTASYGLDDPGVIVLTTSDDTYKLSIGNLSPTSEYFYVTVDGRDKVYVISSLYGSVLKTSRMMLRSKDIIPYGDHELSGIKVSHNGKVAYELTIDKDTLAWSLPEKYSALPFDASSVDSLVTSLTRLTFSLENMREEAPDLSVYGLDKPDYTACIKGLDGTERNLLINTQYDTKDNTSSIYIKENDQVVLMSTGSLSFLKKEPFSFIVNSVKNAEYNTVSGFEYTLGDVSASFTMDTQERKGTMDGREFTLSNEFQTFFASLANEKMSSIDPDAEPELKDPLLTVVFHNTDGTDKTYQLTDAGDKQCYVFTDGKYTGALVDSENLSGKNSIKYFYDEFIETSGLK